MSRMGMPALVTWVRHGNNPVGVTAATMKASILRWIIVLQISSCGPTSASDCAASTTTSTPTSFAAALAPSDTNDQYGSLTFLSSTPNVFSAAIADPHWNANAAAAANDKSHCFLIAWFLPARPMKSRPMLIDSCTVSDIPVDRRTERPRMVSSY